MPKREMNVLWRVFVDAKNDRGAVVLLAKVGEALGIQTETARVEPYHKGGYILVLSVTVKSKSWPEAVVALLAQAQRLGRGWQLSGSILEELDAWSNETNIAGVQSVHVQCQRMA